MLPESTGESKRGAQHPHPTVPGLAAHCAWVAAAGGGLHGRRVFYFYAQAKNKSRAKANPTTHLNICRVTIIFISHAAQPALPAARCLCLLLLLLLISANLRSSSNNNNISNHQRQCSKALCHCALLSLSLSLPVCTLSIYLALSCARKLSHSCVWHCCCRSLSLALSLMRAQQVFFLPLAVYYF